MSSDGASLLFHELTFVLFDVPADAQVRIDLAAASGAALALHDAVPALRIGSTFGEATIRMNGFSLQPRRLQFRLAGAPDELPISLRVASASAFLFGWLQVPDGVQTMIATAAQGMRIVGPSYWALPVVVPHAGALPSNVREGPPSGTRSASVRSTTERGASTAPP